MGLKKVIHEEIQETILDGIIDLLEGVGDKYAEKQFGIPDDQEQKYLRQTAGVAKTADMGEMVGRSVSNYNQGDQSDIYKNPRSLKDFEAGVRAVSDPEGNLYVAQHNGDFVHKGMQDSVPRYDIYRNDFVITWHRVKNSNIFGFSDSFTGYGLNNREEVEERIKQLRQRHPAFRFIPQYYFGIDVNDIDMEARAEPMEYFESSDHREMKMPEGVGDKYAQKVAGIPDSGEEFEQRWQQHQKTQQRSDENGELVGTVMSMGEWKGDDNIPVNVYKNPKSLQNFEDFVRAIGDDQGNVFVAQINGSFYHENIENLVGLYGEGIKMYRAEKTNLFGISGTYQRQVTGSDNISSEEATRIIRNDPDVTEAFKKLNNNNPNLRFSYLPAFNLMGNRTAKWEIDQSILKEGMAVGDNSGYMQMVKEFEEIVKQEIDNFVEGTGDKYAQKVSGIPDAGEMFDNQYQAHLKSQKQDPSMGEWVLRFDSVQYVKQHGKWVEILVKVNVFKNPKSMNGFPTKVRGISDENGDMYVADVMGDFTHSELGSRIFSGMYDDIYKIQKYVTWYYDKRDAAFSLASVSESAFHRLIGGMYSENIYDRFWNGIRKLKEKNPGYKLEEVDDKLPELKEGVGDKYVEKKFHIPDEETEFEKQWQGELQKNVEKPFKSNGKLDVYKNPSSLKHFDNSVRAIADENGDLYVAQQDLPFSHAELAQFIGLVKEYRDYWFMVEKLPALHRRGNTNTFGLSDSSVKNIKRSEDNRNKVRDIFSKTKQKNPEFDFTLKYYFDEGVGDKYAEKKWGIPDADTEYHNQGVPDADMGERIADVWGHSWKDNKNTNYGPIYKNPKSLRGFDADARAIALDDGTLYVAQRNADFIHVDMELALEKVEGPLGEYYEFHRVGTKNEFGASDTLIHKIQDYAVDMRGMIEELEAKHPQFEFSSTYYEYLRNSINEVIREEIQETVLDGIVLLLEEYGASKTPQEIADNLRPSEYWQRMERNNPEYYAEQKPVLANVDMELADKAFQEDHDFYIGKDDRGIGNRKERVMQTIEDGSLMYAPDASIRVSQGTPILSFGDGRHRFAVLRDLGVESINITFGVDSQPYIHLLQR